MSVTDFYINPHLIPFYVLFFIGASLILLSPLSYCWRNKKFFIFPRELSNYNNFEKKTLLIGIIMVFLGILGVAIISEIFGYNVIHTDIHGNKTIERINP